ncbi:MAG: RraA family protein [Anaerolineae bacterium]|jgi:regulator of RNase E activity RraA|nr:RraA family protein [Anaerolineae bacterium]
MTIWKTDEELFALARRELFTAVVGDTMDKHGLTRQFLPASLQPLRDDMVVIGRAMPVLVADYFSERVAGQTPVAAKPFGLLFEALDDLKPHEIYLATGGSPYYALWGELLSTRAMQLGAAGAILNGYSRDTRGILRLGFPVFSAGRYAQDQGVRGKVVDFRIPIEIGQTRIYPGDILFGDLDGVCVVPQAVSDDIFTGALEKVRGENQVRLALESGMSAVAAFAKFGIM